MDGYVQIKYCATHPPTPPAWADSVSRRMGISHRDAEILRVAARVRELAASPGEDDRGAGTRFLLFRRSLRTRRERGDDGPLEQRISQDRRPPSRQRGAAVAAHLVLSRRAADRPEYEGAPKACRGGV